LVASPAVAKTRQRLLLAVLLSTTIGACDKLYCAKITGTLPKTSSKPGYELANNLLTSLATPFHLQCSPDHFIEIPSPGYMIQTAHCFRQQDNNSVEVAFNGSEITVVVERLGMLAEPEDFRSLREALATELHQTFSSDRVHSEYPCRR